MREILFRGKTKDGRWLYGLLEYNYYPGAYEYKYAIKFGESMIDSLPVIEKTIGQFTGLKDVHRNKIFEGDITKYGYVITYVDGSKGEDLGMNIGFYEQRDNFESWSMLEGGVEYEIIGNIYENKTC